MKLGLHVRASLCALLTLTMLLAPLSGYAQSQQREKLKVAQTVMLPLQDFNGVELQLPVKMTIRQGKDFQVKVESDYADLIEDISIDVQSNRLVVNGTEAIREEMNSLKKFPILRLEVQMPQLVFANLLGNAELVVEKTMKTSGLEIINKGSGKVKMDDLQAENSVKLRLMGSGDIKMRGLKASVVDVELVGSGDIETKDLDIKSGFTATLAGSGDIETGRIKASSVDITVNGSGGVDVKQITKCQRVMALLKGSGKASLGDVESSVISLTTKGSGNLKFKGVKANEVSLQTHGKGDIEAKSSGKTERCTIDIMGKGDVDVKKLEAQFVTVKIAGKGGVTVFATNELHVDSGKFKTEVKYRGNARAIVAPNSRARLKPIK